MQLALGISWPLWLLCAVPLMAWLAWRNRKIVGPRRMLAVALLRCLCLALIAFALTMPRLSVPTRGISVVYALDVSDSMDPAFVHGALDWIRDANARYRPAHASYVLFAQGAQLLEDPAHMRAQVLRQLSGTQSALDVQATNLERALGTALSGFALEYARRLVLISDGNQTQGDVWRALPQLRAEGVRVFAFPAPARFATKTWIDAIEAPDDIRQRQPVELRVRLNASAATSVRIEVFIDSGRVATRALEVAPGTSEVPFEVRFRRAGLNAVRVALSAPDGGRDARTESVWVGSPLRVLHVEGGAPAGYLPGALQHEGMDVRRFSAQQFAEAPGPALRAADAVVLSDVPADVMGAEATRRLRAFVRDSGGGLVFVSGENTYGKDGFSGSEVERLLPVKFEARRKRQDLDLVLLIDRSFSMRGSKLEFAKSAAQATLDLLEAQHRLAVVAFDSQPHEVVPLAPVGNRRRAQDLISRMTTGGRTDIYNALWRARELLADSTAATKHVILLSDGQTAPAPSAQATSKSGRKSNAMLEMLTKMGYGVGNIERLIGEDAPQRPEGASGGFEELVASMARANITLSTVVIGEQANLALMTGLAAWGHGQSHVAQRDSEIPALFVSEARRLLGESLIEQPFRPIVKGSSTMLGGVDFVSAPQLKGQVAGKAKRFADVLLEGNERRPLLVQTRYGLGHSVAFLSDAKNRWAVDWIGWPGYAKFWAQVVRSAARGTATAELAWQVTRHDSEAWMRLTAFQSDATFRDNLWPQVRVQRPDGRSSVVALRQSAPGTYSVKILLDERSSAPYRFDLLPGAGLSVQDITRVGARMLYYAQSDEQRARPADVALLHALSERTGGRLVATPADILKAGADTGTAERSLAPALACAAMFAFLFEIAVRRWRRPASRQRNMPRR